MNSWANILFIRNVYLIFSFTTNICPNAVNESVKRVVNAPTQQNNVYQVTYVR